MNESTPPRIMPPIWFFAAIGLMFGLHRVYPGPRWLEDPPLWLAALIFAIGFVVAMKGNRLFARRGTTIRPFEESEVLVTDGPFRFSRNPMYLGMSLGLIAVGVALGTLVPLVVIPLFVGREERDGLLELILNQVKRLLCHERRGQRCVGGR